MKTSSKDTKLILTSFLDTLHVSMYFFFLINFKFRISCHILCVTINNFNFFSNKVEHTLLFSHLIFYLLFILALWNSHIPSSVFYPSVYLTIFHTKQTFSAKFKAERELCVGFCALQPWILLWVIDPKSKLMQAGSPESKPGACLSSTD